MSVAIVTGASKGIGKAIATDLASRGYDLMLIARSENLLKDLSTSLSASYKVTCNYLCLDLADPASVDSIVNSVNERKYPVEILVNNAGYAVWGEFERLKLEDQLKMMFVNLDLMVSLTHRLLPVLKKSKKSFILNVSSSSAYQAVPTLAVYCSSKAFILQFSRSLKHELRNSGVTVSCLVPGPTETEFMDAAGMTSAEMKKRAARFNMKAGEVAEIAIRGLMNGKAEIIPGFLNRFQAQMVRLVPKSLTEKIAAGLYKVDPE